MSWSTLRSWLGSSNVSTVSQEGSLVELIRVLSQIDPSAPEAEINEGSISDNNGGRIIL